MGVTAIKSLANFTKGEVLIRDLENGSSRVIGARTARGFDYWIPWCRSQNEFGVHHIEIEVPKGQRKFYIWQSADQDGDYVRFSTDGQYHASGTRVPGVSTVNGNRLIVIREDGSFNVQYSGD